ncbi:carbohydrate-binding protein [Actinoplanes sp. NPDC051494]|uniref:carbohydrate-binding protein n=1 Tax=Actinoplanes sp. NPDC051494 TaxID=3363907 RepID=UPI0037B5121F
MNTTASPQPGVYSSRSKITQQRVLLAVAGLALLLVGYTIGWFQGSSSTPAPAAAAPLPVASGPSPSASESPSPSASASKSPSPSPSPTPDEPKGGTSAYSTIQAEDTANQQGTEPQDTEDTGGGRNIGWINNGDWLQYNDINFGNTPATQFGVRAASGAGGSVNGQLELRLDTLGSAPIGSLTIADTGGWQTWQTLTTTISPASGKHTLYLTFTASDGSDFANINFFAFGR